ncbi:MAG TPA: DUF3108 domain-containing protein [Bryobacteraceae bacterium]|nr:DUF3108 domain-containing protein [Bryobacteraceae bacterium]
MALLGLSFAALPCRSGPANSAIEHTAPIASHETLHYGVEWRLIRAGIARVTWSPALGNTFHGTLQLQSVGMVSKLYKVNDNYTVRLVEELCADDIFLKAVEGKRNRETKITFDRKNAKAHYVERDLVKNTTVLAKETDVPACVQDIVAGLYRMRTLRLEPGQSATIPVTDGKKFANAKVEAQERENVKTPTGTHKTIRHEAYIFNGVLYGRNARCLVWLSDDARRTPVRIQVRLRFLIGTITLTLEKEERS